MKRRLILLMLAAMMSMLLISCSYDNRREDQNLPQIRIGGSIYEPYFYKDIDGKYTGIDVEIAKEACKRLGYEPVFIEMDLDKRTQFIQDGTIDCMWSCLSIEEYRKDYLWAGPYLYSRRVVVVPKDSDVDKVDDLEGKTIAVQANSTSESIFLKNTTKTIPKVEKVETFRTIGEVFTALRKGYVDAIAGHEGALLVYTRDYPEQYRYLNISIHKSQLGVAFPKTADKQLVDELTDILQEMNADGTIGEIIRRYGLDVDKNVYGGDD